MRVAVAMILAGAAMLPPTTARAQANDTRNSFVERRLGMLATVSASAWRGWRSSDGRDHKAVFVDPMRGNAAALHRLLP
jgi:hypothetical protein